MGLETEAEGLMARELEGILEQESPETQMKLVLVLPADLPGTKTLFTAGPPIRLGGMLSVNLHCNVQENGFLYSKYIINVNQGSTSSSNNNSNNKKENGRRSTIEKKKHSAF